MFCSQNARTFHSSYLEACEVERTQKGMGGRGGGNKTKHPKRKQVMTSCYEHLAFELLYPSKLFFFSYTDREWMRTWGDHKQPVGTGARAKKSQPITRTCGGCWPRGRNHSSKSIYERWSRACDDEISTTAWMYCTEVCLSFSSFVKCLHLSPITRLYPFVLSDPVPPDLAGVALAWSSFSPIVLSERLLKCSG